jgi:hypothetical protein
MGTARRRIAGAVLPEANDEWQLQHRYVLVEAITYRFPVSWKRSSSTEENLSTQLRTAAV